MNARFGHLNKLRDELLGLVDGKEPNRALTNAEKYDISTHPGNWVLKNSRDGSEFAVSVVEVANYRKGEYSIFMKDWQTELNLDVDVFFWCSVDEKIATLFVNICIAVHDLRVEQNTDQSDYRPPPTLPHELIRVSNEDFRDILQEQRGRLLYHFGNSALDRIQEIFSN